MELKGDPALSHHVLPGCCSETGDGHGNVVGSYNLADIDGRVRKVNYVADRAHGFRAVINTNEPGTAASLPAAAVMASPYKGSIAGSYGISHAAPIAVAAAPVAVAAAPIGVAGVGLGGLGLGVKGVGLGGIGLAGAGHCSGETGSPKIKQNEFEG
ncbi:hypothetical protein LAZ67_13000347 [Cordylochernes scorpioides]|uniref:Adult-specific rigid cuticular protein 15.7 n=1 Tax=Cordylochernes scorpioides TaxID=51811 RepID=A0ABY6L2U2_9ARAC|nr:hypothetical protein LAZ67_13000347 [Cordylochernes scorpioides]